MRYIVAEITILSQEKKRKKIVLLEKKIVKQMKIKCESIDAGRFMLTLGCHLIFRTTLFLLGDCMILGESIECEKIYYKFQKIRCYCTQSTVVNDKCYSKQFCTKPRDTHSMWQIDFSFFTCRLIPRYIPISFKNFERWNKSFSSAEVWCVWFDFDYWSLWLLEQVKKKTYK